jgi:transcriptional regulator with XRE-family HTH domain
MSTMSIEDPKVSRIVIHDGQHFARILRAARVTAKRTQADVAGRLGIKRQTLAAREQGIRNLSVAEAIRALDELGYDFSVVPRED